MWVVHTVNSLRASHGGPSRSITALALATEAVGVDVSLVTHADVESTQCVSTGSLPVHRTAAEPFREMFGARGALQTTLEAAARGESVLHDHGLWLPINRAVAAFAYQNKLPRMVSVRGMLSNAALAESRIKKQVALALYQRRDLQSAVCLHVTSIDELESIRRLGVPNPVAVITNGVELPSPLSNDGATSVRRALFLSRIHSIKGVDHLLEAWSVVRREGWVLTIAGPEEDGQLAQRVRDAAERDTSIEVIGPVDDEGKWAVYRSADLFVLPTMSENFGIVIAEALASGVPVITTKAAPWQELESHRCGWWIDTGTRPLIDAMRAAMDLSDEERRAMGARGRRLMADNYSWDEVARKMIAVYEWVLGRGSRPDWVDV